MKVLTRVGLIFLLAGGFAFRLYRLGASSLWYDETVSLYLARQDLVALTRHTAGDIHPPLYYYLLHFWGQFAGWSEFSSAFLSLFLGVLLIALVYRVAHEWFNTRVALLAAFLVTISPYNLWYSQEVRMYTLGAALGLASVFFFWRLFFTPAETLSLRERVRSRDFAAYAIVSALGLYTLYYFAFLIVFEDLALALAILRRSRVAVRSRASSLWDSRLGTWIASQFAVLVLYLPWIPFALRQAIDPPVPPWRSFSPLGDVLVESFSALTLGQSVEPGTVWPVLILAAAIIGVALVKNRHSSTIHPVALLGYTLVPLLLIYTLSLWKPLYHVRYVFIYSPGFYLLFALGLDRLSDWRFARRALLYICLVGLAAASAYSAYNFWYNPTFAEDDLRGAVERIAELWRPGDAILIDAGYTYTAFDYYNTLPVTWRGRLTDYAPSGAATGAIVLQTGSIGGDSHLGWGSPESDFYPTTAETTRAALARVFAAHSRVWLLRLYDTVVDPDGVIRDYLATRGRIFDDAGFAGNSFMRVQGYLTPRAALTQLPAAATPRGVTFGGRIVLLGFEPETLAARAGAPLDFNLYWQAREATNVDQHLFVGLYGSDGQMVASHDELPLGNALGTSRWSSQIWQEPVRMLIPKNIPEGDYVLRATLYNPMTNEPLTAGASEWVVEETQVELSKVHIQN